MQLESDIIYGKTLTLNNEKDQKKGKKDQSLDWRQKLRHWVPGCSYDSNQKQKIRFRLSSLAKVTNKSK